MLEAPRLLELSTQRAILFLVSGGKLQPGPIYNAVCQLTLQSSTCIPNPSIIHILAPIYHAGICPLESERWELRARCFDCHVSTITFITCIISICSTLVVIGFIALGIRLVSVFQRWKSQNRNWWKVRRVSRSGWWLGCQPGRADLREQDSADQRPLLGDI